MKKRALGILFLLIFLQVAFINAAVTKTCDLDATIINQDPYPAVPGEPLKVVFQVSGVTNSDCGNVKVKLIQDFPFVLEPGSNPLVQIIAGTYVKDYQSFLLTPYELIVDKDAVEGTNTLSLELTGSTGAITQDFDVEVLDSRTDFEVSIRDYDKSSKTLTFQILNSGEHDVEALTIDIPKQDTLAIKGSPRKIVGSLDANDDTTFSFEGIPSDGDIDLIITYTDEISERRTLEKVVSFDSDYYNGRGEEKARTGWFYVTLILVLGILFYWYKKRKQKKKERRHHRE